MIRLIFSILGLVAGILSIFIRFASGSPADITGKVLIVICGMYIVYFFVKKRQAQKRRQLAGQARTSQLQTQENFRIDFPFQELQLYDTENRLKGVIQTNGTLYNEGGSEVGKIFEIDQDRCIVQNNSTSPVVWVKRDGRISSWNGSLGRVDPDNGLVYKHTGSGRPIGIIGKVSPLGDIYWMGAVASLLLSGQMGA